MNSIVIQRVTNSRQRKQFLELPWTIYRKDPFWIPPLRLDEKENVGYSHNPFYDRNQIQTFLAYRGGEVVGRIGAILNQGHINRYDDRRGFFGFFESIDDQEVANGLFDAARDWFADQGIYKLRGPTNPSLNATVGLLIDGFDSSPTFMMTYNPRYYERLIENYGFRKTQDLYAFWGHISMLPKVAEKLRPIADQIIERYNVKVRPLDKSRFLRRRQIVPLDLQPLADEHLGLRSHVRRRSGARRQGPATPHRARTGHLRGDRRAAGGGMLRAVGLQPADQGNRRPALSLRLHPSLAQEERDQEDPFDLDQRAARVPDAGAGIGAHARHRAQGDRVGHPGGRILLGAGIEQLLPRGLDQGRGQDHQDLSHLRSRLRSGRSRGPAADRTAGRHKRAAGNPAGRLRPRPQRLPQGALAGLCRRSAMGAAVVAGPERVPQSPQASLLSARGGREIHRLSRRRAPGTHPRERRPPL